MPAGPPRRERPCRSQRPRRPLVPSPRQLVDDGSLHATRFAPGCPKIEQHRVPAEVAQTKRLLAVPDGRRVGDERESEIRRIAPDVEPLMRPQKAWKEPEACEKQEHRPQRAEPRSGRGRL